MKKEITTLNYYDAISRGYKNLYHEEQIKKISLIKQFLPKEGNLLDLGSADGVINRFLNPNLNVISIDLSYEMLKLNNNKNKIFASILNLPIKANSIDTIISFTVFQDLPDTKIALEQACRVLKSKGVFILSFLKIAKSAEEIIERIGKKFEIIEKITEEKDYIFILKKRD